jgi:phosphoglycerol transferase MdoB-like AlkP superfamily enzyme
MISVQEAELSNSEAMRIQAPAPEAASRSDSFWSRAVGLLPRLPANAVPRLVLLFASLAIIKVILIAQTSKHLFEVHWRIAETETTWIHQLAFAILVILGIANTFRLANQCRTIGIGALRAANALVFSLGLFLILLTFHGERSNYLYPIINGVLAWDSLVPYLSLDLFFHPPFLAAWVLGYGIAYAILARIDRERWTLHLTAVVGGVYALVCLRELAAHHEEILVADCLGLVALLFPWQRGRAGWAWLAAPAIWSCLFAGVMLSLAGLQFGPATAYFITLVGGSLVILAGSAAFAWNRNFLEPWLRVAFFFFTAFVLLINSNYPASTNLNRLLCLGMEVPHYFAGEMLVVGFLAIAALLFSKIRPGTGYWWLDTLVLALITVALIDLRLSQIMGLRLEWNFLAFANSPKMMWRMARPYLPAMFALLGVVVVVYALMLKGLGRCFTRQREAESRSSGRSGLRYAAATFLALSILGLFLNDSDKAEGQSALRLAQTSPLWKRATNRVLSPDEFHRAAKELGLGDFETPPGPAVGVAPRDLNVLLIFQESSYNKYLSLFGCAEDTQPLLSKYRDRMELFPDFFSNFASSIHARFATFTSLYPTKDFNAFTLERVGVKSVFEILHDHGYSCSLFYSSFFDYTGFGDFLRNRGLEEMYDANNMPGQRTTERVSWGLREEETLGAIRSQIKRYAAYGQRFFLTYVPAAPHYPYEKVPETFHKYKTGRMGDYTPLYLNELLYMDWVQASILDQLKESGLLEKTLVVITDDHGEMLGADDGQIGHGWALTPELANAPLIILDPQNPGYRVNATIGSQVDLLPTLMDRLRIPMPGDQLYEGRSLDSGKTGSHRFAYLNAYQQYGIIDGNRLVMGDRERQGSGNGKSTGSAFSISNLGTRTFFSQEQSLAELPASIRKFDDFQETLLRNYSLYCESVRKEKRLVVSDK